MREFVYSMIRIVTDIHSKILSWNNGYEVRNLTTKVFMAEPSEILSYGFLRPEYRDTLSVLHVPFREEPDYRSVRFGRTNRKAA